MNYFLVLSEINSYFQGVSSLDTKLMASAIACDNICYDSILGFLSVYIPGPDYYENNYWNDAKFGREEIEYEAKRRNFNYDVIEKTNEEDGNEECEISISIYGETFVLHTDKWKDSSIEVVLGEHYGLTFPEIYIDDLFDMFEELVQEKYALRGLMSIYMSIIESSVDSDSLKKALILQLFLVPILTSGLYSGLFELVYLIQNDYEVGELLLTDEEAHSKNIGLIWSPEEFRNHCDEIVADCKRNLKVEQVASNLVQTAMEGFPRANDIRYTCFSNGTLLLAPYRKTGAIMGFVKYTELPRLNDIIRAITTFNDDQVDSLPEGFILLKD